MSDDAGGDAADDEDQAAEEFAVSPGQRSGARASRPLAPVLPRFPAGARYWRVDALKGVPDRWHLYRCSADWPYRCARAR